MTKMHRRADWADEMGPGAAAGDAGMGPQGGAYGMGYGPGYGPGYGYGSGYGPAGYGPGYGQGYGPAADAAAYGRGPLDPGLLQGLPAFLRSRSTEQFLLGAAIGAAAAWVLSDEELRGKLVKGAMRLYAGVAGSFEEMKEQMSDIKAEVEAERHGDA